MKRVVEVEFEEVSLTVTYDHDGLARATGEHASPAAVAGDVPAANSFTVNALADAIVSWDLTEDDLWR